MGIVIAVNSVMNFTIFQRISVTCYQFCHLKFPLAAEISSVQEHKSILFLCNNKGGKILISPAFVTEGGNMKRKTASNEICIVHKL